MNIQKMWAYWIERNPTNHPLQRKVQREAFFAGAEMMLDHIHSAERIAADLIQQQGDPFEVIEGGLSERRVSEQLSFVPGRRETDGIED